MASKRLVAFLSGNVVKRTEEALTWLCPPEGKGILELRSSKQCKDVEYTNHAKV